jgi:hypothetical protein
VETCPVNCIQSIGAGAHVQTLGIGSTWIALSKASYGIHGTPESSEVGRRLARLCAPDQRGRAAPCVDDLAQRAGQLQKPDMNFVAY